MNVDYGVRENMSSAQDNRVVRDITSTHFLLMFMLSELHNGCLYLCPATPGRLNDLVMSRVVDLRSVTFLVGLART